MTKDKKKPGPDPELLIVTGSTEGVAKKVFDAGKPGPDWEEELEAVTEPDDEKPEEEGEG